MPFFHQEDLQVEIAEPLVDDPARLVVFNDEVNTFDWVIQCFIDILRHSQEQAEQLSYIIHFNGKATVKTAPKDELMPHKQALVDRGLSCVIQA